MALTDASEPLGQGAASAITTQLDKLKDAGDPVPLRNWKAANHMEKRELALKLKLDRTGAFFHVTETDGSS